MSSDNIYTLHGSLFESWIQQFKVTCRDVERSVSVFNYKIFTVDLSAFALNVIPDCTLNCDLTCKSSLLFHNTN